MMKTVAALALVGSAVAFAPAQQGRVNTAVAGKFDGELGAMVPLGYFDPLGLCADGDQENFDRLRLAEIKHGRISMLAVVGYLTTASGYRFPNFPADIPAGFKAFPALAASEDGKQVLIQMAATAAIAEIVSRDADWIDNTPEFPGDFRNGGPLDFGWDKFDDETKFKKRTIELNNGRAAMCGILGLMVHEQLGVSILPANPYGL